MAESARQEEIRKTVTDTQHKTVDEMETPVKKPTRADERGLSMPAAKRIGPPDVTPLTIGDMRIEAVHWGKELGFQQNGGHIAAIDVGTGKELWTLKVYDIDYDEKMESDLQDIFIETISNGITDGTIEIVDERRRHFIVDLESRSVKYE